MQLQYTAILMFFSRTQQGFPFHSGGLGVEGLFARRCVYVRNRPRPFATIRNRPREGRMAVRMASSATGVTFGNFQRRFASFRVDFVTFRRFL